MKKGWENYILTSERDEIGPLTSKYSYDFKPHEHYITTGYALPEGNNSKIIVERFYGFPKSDDNLK